MKVRLAYLVCYVIVGLCALQQAVHAAGIATVVDVVNEGYRTPPGSDEFTAKTDDELVQHEALRTEQDSAIKMRFIDGSELSVEQSSEVVLSDYLFDGSAASGIIDLNDGLFHFTSNETSDQELKLRTPVATIGIRGTEFLVHVDGGGATIIDILEGEVDAVPHGIGKPAICIGGQSILITAPDQDALCGDIGAFSTAAAPPSDESDRPETAHGGQDRPRTERKNSEPSRKDPPRADPPKPDPPSPPGCGGATC
jgi:hypothetical protein